MITAPLCPVTLPPRRRELLRWQAIASPSGILSGAYRFLLTLDPIAASDVGTCRPGPRYSQILIARFFCPTCPSLITWALFEDETRELARPVCPHCNLPVPDWWRQLRQAVGEISDLAVNTLRERFVQYHWGCAERERAQLRPAYEQACKVGGNARQRRLIRRIADRKWQADEAAICAAHGTTAANAMFSNGRHRTWNP